MSSTTFQTLQLACLPPSPRAVASPSHTAPWHSRWASLRTEVTGKASEGRCRICFCRMMSLRQEEVMDSVVGRAWEPASPAQRKGQAHLDTERLMHAEGGRLTGTCQRLSHLCPPWWRSPARGGRRPVRVAVAISATQGHNSIQTGPPSCWQAVCSQERTSPLP